MLTLTSTSSNANDRNGSTGDANNYHDNSNVRGRHTDTHDKAGRRSRLGRTLQPLPWGERPHLERRKKALRIKPASANGTQPEAASTTDPDTEPHDSPFRRSSSYCDQRSLVCPEANAQGALDER
jgi:hypothetical protein